MNRHAERRLLTAMWRSGTLRPYDGCLRCDRPFSDGRLRINAAGVVVHAECLPTIGRRFSLRRWSR